MLRIYLPPLRERREDIPRLVRKFIRDFEREHDRAFPGISAEAMGMLVDYDWPGNVRELRNLVENMVVLSPGREVQPDDLPRQIRDGGIARLLPVHIGPLVRGEQGSRGRELDFIVRNLVELKLQVEELRRRMEDERATRAEWPRGEWVGEVGSGSASVSLPAAAIEARDAPPPTNVVTVSPGMTMAEIEKAVIQSALRETNGNRRRAAEMLGIGERTLYRKLREYQLLERATAS